MPDNTEQNIKLNVSVDAQDAIKQIATAQVQVQNLRAETNKLSADYKTNTTQVDANKQKIKELSAEIKNKETFVQKELTSLNTNLAGHAKLATQYEVSKQKVKDLSAAYGENSEQVIAASNSLNEISEKLKSTTAIVNKSQETSEKLGATLKTVGGAIGAIVPQAGKAIAVLNKFSAVFDTIKLVIDSARFSMNNFNQVAEGISNTGSYILKSVQQNNFSFKGMSEAYKAGKEYQANLQRLSVESDALEIKIAQDNAKINKSLSDLKTGNLNKDQRSTIENSVVKTVTEDGNKAQEIANTAYNSMAKKIASQTKMSAADFENFMSTYVQKSDAELKKLEKHAKDYMKSKAQGEGTKGLDGLSQEMKKFALNYEKYNTGNAEELKLIKDLYLNKVNVKNQSESSLANVKNQIQNINKEKSTDNLSKKEEDAEKRNQAAERRKKQKEQAYADQEALDEVAILKTEKNTKERLDTEIKLIEDQQAHKIYDAHGNAAQIKLINENADNEILEKKKEYEEALKDLKQKTLSFLKQNLEMQVDERKKATEEELKSLQRLNKEGKLSAQELALYTVAVKKQEAEDIKNIKLKSLKDQQALIDAQLDQKYALRLARAVGDEEEVTDLMIAKEKERLEKLKQEKADADFKVLNETQDQAKNNKDQDTADAAGVAVTNSENNLNALTIKQTQQKYAAELIAARHSAEETYKIKRKELTDELMLSNLGANEQAKIQAEIQDLDQAHTLKKIENVKEWADKSIALGSQVSSLFKALGDTEVQKAETDNNAKKTALDNQLSSGLITKKQHDKEVAKSEADLAAKKKKVAQDQAKREKLINLFNVAVNTGEAVAKIMTTIGVLQSNPLTVAYVPAAYASLAYTIAAGAAQAAVIAATPLPTAGRGMLLRGKSHAQGGIPIEVEGGEAIINKRSTTMYGSVLSAINEAGGGVKFAGGGMVGKYATGGIANYAFSNDGGYSARTQANAITASDMHQAMVAAVSQVKVYTTVEDYRKADKNYTNIESSGSV